MLEDYKKNLINQITKYRQITDPNLTSPDIYNTCESIIKLIKDELILEVEPVDPNNKINNQSGYQKYFADMANTDFYSKLSHEQYKALLELEFQDSK